MGKIKGGNATACNNIRTTIWMHGYWGMRCVGCRSSLSMGRLRFLSYSHFTLVYIRLDTPFHSTGKLWIVSGGSCAQYGFFQNGSLPFNKFDFVVGWLFRECSSPYLFLHAILDPTIRWRSRVFKLAWGGVAQEIKPRIKF